MTHHPICNVLKRLASALLLCVYAGIASAQTPPPYVFSGPLLPLLLQMPENSWLNANANLYSDVWTPDELEPLALDAARSHLPRSLSRGADSPGTAIAAT